MQQSYRGHVIEIVAAATWQAVLTEARSGAVLPTKAVASHEEGPVAALRRGRSLVDTYVAGGAIALGLAAATESSARFVRPPSR